MGWNNSQQLHIIGHVWPEPSVLPQVFAFGKSFRYADAYPFASEESL